MKEKKTIAISINNKTVHMDKDWTVLQACEKIGLFIPRFCYSESLSIAGNCRMCLVEIEKSPKLMPSCAIKINEGMKIHTKTNLVKKTRENILEFLLINHPLDCPICDQGGECDLQDQAMIYGSDRGRFKEYKRSVQDKNAGPLIKTIMTRCIHCTRCIRFATEIAGVESLGTTGRGKTMEVGSYISNLFSSELSGNVIDLCPVGALTSKPYAFTVRPWELKSVDSIDVLDGIGSSIRLDAKGSDLMRVLPRANDLVNQQWISDKTRFSYDGLKNQRLQYPIIATTNKTDGSKNFTPTTWKDSLSLFKSKFDSVIKDKEKSGKTLNVKGIVGPFVDQETILSFKNFLNKLGSSDLYIQNPQNCLNFGNVDIDDRANYLLSWNEHLQNSQEMGHNPDFFLLIGTNPRFEASTFNIRLRRIILQSTSSSTKSQNPNFKNIPLAYIGEPMDLTYPSHHIGSGSKDLVFLSQGKDIWSKNFLKAKRPLPIMGFSPLQRKDGYSCLKAMDILTIYHNKIRNILKEKNESIYSLSSGFNVSSLFSTEYFLKSQKPLTITNKWFIPSSSKSDISILHPYASTAGAFDLGFYPGKTSQIFQNQKNSDTDFVFLLGADEKKNYVQVLNQGKKDFQTDNKPFVLYQGHHGELGAKQADLILPSTSYVEKKGTYVNTEGLVQRTDTIGNMQVQSSVDNEAHDDWKIVHALLSILDLKNWQTSKTKLAVDSFISLLGEKTLMNSGTGSRQIQSGDLNPNLQILKETALKNGLSKWFSSKAKKELKFYFSKRNETNHAFDISNFNSVKLANKNQKVLKSKSIFKVVNKKTLSDLEISILLKYCSQDVAISLGNENSIFENIAPHLDQIDDFSATNSYRKTFTDRSLISKKNYNKDLTKTFPFENTCFIPLFDNYYQTDVISKSSITMGKSSLSFKNQSWPF